MADHKDLIERLRSGKECQDKCRVMDAASGCICAEAADALEAAQEQCVEVKPLVWERSVSVGEVYEAKTLAGEYVCGVDNYGFAYGSDKPNGEAWDDFDSLDDAKAAAQADYERRVLASITTRPVSDIWAEATAAAYGRARKVAGAWGGTTVANLIHNEIASLTPQSARDWLAEREAATRADERAKVYDAISHVETGEDAELALRSLALQMLVVIKSDASRALPIKEKDDE